ncbi:MAG TPA: carboxypeptidase-like regulatory domain-containing protein [Thermoanaerobaculia bacterium]|nr:carboxypeptidase-like regulatory domain-containing protein [Thermoanaerobaculia bacterium]
MRRRRYLHFMRLALLLAITAVPLLGDAPLQTATVSGLVTSSQSPLPGTVVTLSSATLHRVASTDTQGRYTFADLPPGDYDETFELDGLQTTHYYVTIAPGTTTIPAEDLRVNATEAIVMACGSPCTDADPATAVDRPSCRDYELNDALIGAIERHDQSSIDLLRSRHDMMPALLERYRIAGALLGHVDDDRQYWDELHAAAANAVRFAKREREPNEKLAPFCAERGWDPDEYYWVALEALRIAGADRRSHALLLEALATDDADLKYAAIESLGRQHDESALTTIEETLRHLPENERGIAGALVSFESESADRLAMKYLSESEAHYYLEFRRERSH